MIDFGGDDCGTEVRALLRKHLPSDAEVLVFGSRVKGTARPFSDLDLAVRFQASSLSSDAWVALVDAFRESDLPYAVDLIDLDQVSDDFQGRILRDAQRIV